jgi:DNA-binding transcriptional LysR family regulator
MEADLTALRVDLSAAEIELAGTVRIGAPDGFGTWFLTPRLAKLGLRHPNLTIQLAPVPRSFSLSKREADIAISVERPETGRLHVRKLVDYSLHLYASETYINKFGAPQDRAALPGHHLVTYVQDLIYSGALNFMPEVYGPEYQRFECASALAQIEAVRAGAGIGLLHDFVCRNDPTLKLVLPDIKFERTYWMVTHTDTRDLTRVRTVTDFIFEEIAAAHAIFTLARA